MSIQTKPDDSTATGVPNEIDHVYCMCDQNTAFCGLDISDMPGGATWENTCVVCAELVAEGPCLQCGR